MRVFFNFDEVIDYSDLSSFKDDFDSSMKALSRIRGKRKECQEIVESANQMLAEMFEDSLESHAEITDDKTSKRLRTSDASEADSRERKKKLLSAPAEPQQEESIVSTITATEKV